MASILDMKDAQFRLAEDGTISFQAVESNPLPGEVIAQFEKGSSVLTPAIKIINAKGVDETALIARLEAWRDAHIASVLELLVGLKEPLKQPEVKEGEEAPPLLPDIKPVVKDIMDAVYDSLGIIPREQLESLIEKIDADDRRVLRAKRVRLGPILVFIPALNKPAGVRLRGLLWSLFNDQPLPAKVPNDGIVSQVVDDEANRDFYQAIGYPVFGTRAARIDMLDRVICAVYDSAEKGKFRAQHQMAEWLGCPIEDLYSILSAMGHKKIEEQAQEELSKEEAEPQEKPELAEFYLKRGKAFEKGSKKPFKKSDSQKKSEKPKGKRNKSSNRAPKVMSAEAKKVEDSPFAILQQLKTGSDE